MSTSSPSLAQAAPLGLQASEIRTSFIAWGIYLGGMTGYCLLHQLVVSASAPDFVGTVVLALWEWGVWLVTTPLVFRMLRRYDARPETRLIDYLRAAAVVILASAAVPAAIDYVTETRSVTSSMVIFVPRYAAALVVVSLVWRVFLRGSRPAEVASDAAPEPQPQGGVAHPESSTVDGRDVTGLNGVNGLRRDHPQTLLVSKGTGECLIQIDRIQCFSAAGNYVEVHSGNQVYLMRKTMKQVEELLPPSQFVRIHRSHIVNVDEIERIKTQPSGNGAVYLRNGKVLSMSRKYRARLRSH